MNIVVEEKPNCQVTLRVEVPASRVSTARKTVAKEFQQHAKVPGYRPGRAPESVINSRFAKDIQSQLTDKLLRDTINEAIKEKNLRVITVSKVEEVKIGADDTLSYTATIVTTPAFTLPDYSKIEIELAKNAVTEADVDKAMDNLREPHASYEPIEDRGLAMGDFAVVTYEGSIDGKPLNEVIPDAPAFLVGRQNSWIRMDAESFIKGFTEALLGAKADEEIEFDLTVADDFPAEPLRGKTLHYKVKVHALNQRALPEWTDELAGKIVEGKTPAELRELVKKNLEDMAERDFEGRKRALAVQTLLAKVECDLPAHLVEREMNGILQDIVRENQGRGISDEEISKHQDEIVGVAQQNAQERVRSRFLLLRIAEQEKLQVSEQDLIGRIAEMSARYEIPAKKLIKDLQQHDGIEPLKEQVLAGKALDFISLNVSVVEPKQA